MHWYLEVPLSTGAYLFNIVKQLDAKTHNKNCFLILPCPVLQHTQTSCSTVYSMKFSQFLCWNVWEIDWGWIIDQIYIATTKITLWAILNCVLKCILNMTKGWKTVMVLIHVNVLHTSNVMYILNWRIGFKVMAISNSYCSTLICQRWLILIDSSHSGLCPTTTLRADQVLNSALNAVHLYLLVIWMFTGGHWNVILTFLMHIEGRAL